ncbi:MAG: PH domain-containing protein [Coprobacillaceae bacterium]
MFCPKCGFNAEENKFCAGCGTDLSSIQNLDNQTGSINKSNTTTQQVSQEEITLWEGKPQGIGDKAKGFLNDTRYKVTKERIIITDGLIGKKQHEVELRHVKDIQVKQSMTDRLAKVGDITIYTTDNTEGVFVLENIPDAFSVKDMIRRAVLDIRSGITVQYHEKI